MEASRREHVGDVAIGERARQHAARADRVDARTNNVIEILPESGNGNRQ